MPRDYENGEDLLTTTEVASRLRISSRTLRRWVVEGDFPEGVRAHPDARPFWPRSRVESWIANKAQE